VGAWWGQSARTWIFTPPGAGYFSRCGRDGGCDARWARVGTFDLDRGGARPHGGDCAEWGNEAFGIGAPRPRQGYLTVQRRRGAYFADVRRGAPRPSALLIRDGNGRCRCRHDATLSTCGAGRFGFAWGRGWRTSPLPFGRLYYRFCRRGGCRFALALKGQGPLRGRRGRGFRRGGRVPRNGQASATAATRSGRDRNRGLAS